MPAIVTHAVAACRVCNRHYRPHRRPPLLPPSSDAAPCGNECYRVISPAAAPLGPPQTAVAAAAVTGAKRQPSQGQRRKRKRQTAEAPAGGGGKSQSSRCLNKHRAVLKPRKRSRQWICTWSVFKSPNKPVHVPVILDMQPIDNVLRAVPAMWTKMPQHRRSLAAGLQGPRACLSLPQSARPPARRSRCCGPAAVVPQTPLPKMALGAEALPSPLRRKIRHIPKFKTSH